MDSQGTRIGVARLARFFAGSALGLAIGMAFPAWAQAPFPMGGSDAFDSSMSLELDLGALGLASLDLQGPAAVLRSDPAGDPCVIDTEIVSLDLVGSDPLFLGGAIVQVRLNPGISSTGKITAQGPGCTFPADSFFDVFVEVQAGALTLINQAPVRVTNNDLKVIPPFFDTYTHPPPAIPLFDVNDLQGPPIATVSGGSTHRPEQVPSFSVDVGSPLALDPASLHDLGNPPPANLPRLNLGLASGDNIDALSYGVDVIDDFTDPVADGSVMVAFSVDPASLGAPNSGVNRQATKAIPEAEGDEFVTEFRNTNIELVDEQSLVLQQRPTAQGVGDDLDALTGQPTSFADPDGNKVPELPVFFSLDPTSPSLGTLSASAADILFSHNGSTGVYAKAADLGLVSGDDIDGLCLQKSGLPFPVLRPGVGPTPAPPIPGSAQFDYALFSLAPGSPTLTTLGASPADLLITDFSPNRPGMAGTPPAIYAAAAQLGLLAGDNLNAIKCLKSVVFIPMDHPDGQGHLVINLGGTDAIIGSQNPAQVTYDGSYDFWQVRNSAAGDVHGPFVHPQSEFALLTLLPVLDPANTAQVQFVGGPGDNCGFPHVHGTFEGHADPDQPACGHGVFVPIIGPVIPINPCTDIRTVAGDVEAGLAATVSQHPHLAGVSATVHFMSQGVGGSAGGAPGAAAPTPPTTAAAPPPGGPEPAGVALILTGVGRTNIQVDAVGGIGPDIGVPVPALSVPLPEPSSTLGALAALAALSVLRRLRKGSDNDPGNQS